MAQFDVHRNPGKLRETIPYVVLVQSALYDAYRRRVVVPLVRRSVLGQVDSPNLNPMFEIENVAVVLHPLEIVSVASDQLGEFVALLGQGGRPHRCGARRTAHSGLGIRTHDQENRSRFVIGSIGTSIMT